MSEKFTASDSRTNEDAQATDTAPDILSQAEALALEGHDGEAAALFERVGGTLNSQPDALAVYAQVLRRLKRNDVLVDVLTALSAHQPDDQRLAEELAGLHVAAGRYGPAADVLRNLVRRHPAPKNLIRLARVLEKLDAREELAGVLRPLLDAAPDQHEIWRMAFPLLGKEIAAERSVELLKARLEAAEQALAETTRRHQEALNRQAKFERTIERLNAEARSARGAKGAALLEAAGIPPTAMERLRRIAEKDGLAPGLVSQLLAVAALMAGGQPTTAKIAASAMLKDARGCPALLHELQRIFAELKNPASRADALKLLIDAIPGNFDYILRLGNCLRSLGQLEEADQRYAEAMALAPESPEPLRWRIALCSDWGRIPEAIALQERVIALSGGGTGADYAALARLYLKTHGRRTAALHVLRRLLTLEPDDAWGKAAFRGAMEEPEGQDEASPDAPATTGTADAGGGSTGERSGGTAPLYIFFHVPRTGGTSLKSYLAGVLGDVNCLETNAPLLADTVAKIAENRCFLEGDAGQEHVVMGHFPFGLQRLIDRPSRTFAILRDPVERVISEYHFLLPAMKWLPGNQDPAAYFPALSRVHMVKAERLYRANNLQTRMLAGLTPDEPLAPNDEPRILALAKRNLEALDVLLLTEDLGRAGMVLHAAFGWPDTDVGVSNQSSRSSVRGGLRSEIERRNPLDLALYQHARGLYARQLDRLGIAGVP